MKKSLATMIHLVIACSVYAQWTPEFSAGYALSAPTGKMKSNIHSGHGLAIDASFLSPHKKYAVGVDLNYSIYGYDQSRQQYTFPDGATADMDINVTNSFINLMATSRYNLVTGMPLTPYVGAKAGYAWYRTDLNIYDPDDFDNCEPVEKNLLHKDGTWLYAVGGGLQYDLAALFKGLRKEMMFVNLSAYYNQGGRVKYMNTDGPDAHQHHSPPNRTSDVEAAFINTETQVIHKHHVGYVYSSLAQMMDFRLTFTFRMPR